LTGNNSVTNIPVGSAAIICQVTAGKYPTFIDVFMLHKPRYLPLMLFISYISACFVENNRQIYGNKLKKMPII
jgi:hypothetical protein